MKQFIIYETGCVQFNLYEVINILIILNLMFISLLFIIFNTIKYSNKFLEMG
jgi:hypothetical protein